MVDCSALETLDAAAFVVLLGHLHDVAAFTTNVGRVSIVRPDGIAGAIIAGVFHETVRPKFRAALFADRSEAFAWLGRADGPTERVQIDELMATLRATPPPLRALRDYLADDPSTTLVATARTLGLSERSLSRRLRELDTSFRQEVQRARLRAAERLLVETDLKLDAIAHDIGFTSRSHFTDFFRQITGETPSEFRTRRR